MDIFNQSHVKKGEIKLTKEYKRELLFSRFVYYGSILVIVLMCIGAMYAIKVGPVRTAQGTITTEQREVVLGDNVLVTKYNDKLNLSRIITATVKQDVIVGQVIAGPFGQITGDKVKTTSGEIKDVNLGIKTKDIKYLDNQYIIRPTYSNGKEGMDLIVDKGMVVGVLNNGNYHTTHEYSSIAEFTGK